VSQFYRNGSVEDRASNKFLVGDGCWEWIASRDPNGYGRIWAEGSRVVMAHRLVYEMVVGPIPDGLFLDHLCRNRGCVRPDHLEPVTCRENTLRGESPAAIGARKTHCLRGHELTAENNYFVQGKRSCRTCRRAANNAYYRRKTQAA